MKYYDINTNGFYEDNAEGRIELSDENWQSLLTRQSEGCKIQVVNGFVACILPTDEEIQAKEKTLKKADLQIQIDALDIKSIRALREGGIKDETTGQTWAQYYTSQIMELREELSGV